MRDFFRNGKWVRKFKSGEFKIIQDGDLTHNRPVGAFHIVEARFAIAVSEEFAFRGLIMQSIGSWVKIPVLTIVIQAIIFAALHGYNNLGVLIIFISGLVMGFFAWKTNGIEVSSALHTANNLAIALFVMFGIQSTTSSIQLNELAISTVVQIAIFLILYYAGMKTNWFGEIEETVEN